MFAIWIHRKIKHMERLRVEDKKKLDDGTITIDEYNEIAQKGHADAFTLKEIMDAHSMDYEKRKDYTRAYTVLAEERKAIEKYFEQFLISETYQDARKQGKSDDAIWRDFITAANTWNIHLLYSDDDGRYKQITLFSYAQLINQRILAIDRELKRKSDQIKIIGKALPELIPHLMPPELDGFKERHRLLVAHAWACPYCPHLDFPDESELKKHLDEVHSTSNGKKDSSQKKKTSEGDEVFKCPICKAGELRLLRKGEFRCVECRTVIAREDFKKFYPKFGKEEEE
jgi:ribosomal protein L37AE/L43A